MDLSVDIKLTTGGQSFCGSWWNMQAGAIDLCFKLYYVKSGVGWMVFGDEVCEIKGGNFYFINGYKLSQQWSEQLMDIYWVHFVPWAINPSVIYSPLPAFHQWNAEDVDTESFEAGVKGVYCDNLPGLAGIGADFRVRSTANFVLAELLDGCSEGEYREWSAAFSRIKPAIEHMDKYFIDNTPLENLAEIANLTPNYFHRACKKILGVTPYEYMLKKRLNKAKHLLTTTDLPISQVAELTGYENSYYFSRTFRKNTGKTPSQIRKDSPV